ncbi:hypothetical protein AB4Y87_24995 [Paenarthrobacter sp. RAF54_2]|uniref:hypothetical protein n=1 Tax=Paenarthrobacter sp. RAF54_2 TaxID=3233061 RepID=UPI003F9BF9A7
MTVKPMDGWTYPRWIARELAVRCLLDLIEVTKETHDLDLELPAHRPLLEDTDRDVLYDRRFDGFQHYEPRGKQ